MREIYFSVDNNKEILKLPYVPPEIPINSPLNNGSFETINGTILTLIGSLGLRTLTIGSFFPSKLYKWLPYDAPLSTVCLDFFKRNRLKPLRIVITSQDKTFLNMLCTITNFTHNEKQNKDINYSLEVSEYIDPGEVS